MKYILDGNTSDVAKVIQENKIRVARGVISFTPIADSEKETESDTEDKIKTDPEIGKKEDDNNSDDPIIKDSKDILDGDSKEPQGGANVIADNNSEDPVTTKQKTKK